MKSDAAPADWEAPSAAVPAPSVEDADEDGDEYGALVESNEMQGGGETKQLEADADEPLDFSQVNIQGDDTARAEELLARLEMEEAADLAVPAAALVAESAVDQDAEKAAEQAEAEVDGMGAAAAEEGAGVMEEGGEGGDDENGGEPADGLVFKGKAKKGKKKK